jgi:GNAT superfamily N-acetyltransferase
MEIREVRAISAAETRPLRALILRPGQPPERLVYPADDAPDTLHAGAFHEGTLVGIASVARNACPGHVFAEPWQLRGMATTPEVRGLGYGRALIEACVAHVAAHSGQTLWCNGRTSAAGFYTGVGFTPVGGEFVTESGPHFVFFRGVRA